MSACRNYLQEWTARGNEKVCEANLRSNPSCARRCRTPDHICSLRSSFRTLDNFECNRVPFVQGFVSLANDSRVMDKYIWTIIAPDEAVALRCPGRHLRQSSVYRGRPS